MIRSGADGIRCGIGNGSICITRVVAGSGIPQFSAFYEYKVHRVYKNIGWDENLNEDGAFKPDTLLNIHMDTTQINYHIMPIE